MVTALKGEVADSAQAAAKSVEVAETATKSAEAAMIALRAECDKALRRAEAAEAAQIAAQTEHDKAQHRAAELKKQIELTRALLSSHETQLLKAEETIDGKCTVRSNLLPSVFSRFRRWLRLSGVRVCRVTSRGGGSRGRSGRPTPS
jgi:hypothetical protein